MNVLVTGGAGYIGSHAVKLLLQAGHRVVVLDNMVCGNHGAIERLRSLPTARNGRLEFVQGDVTQRSTVLGALLRHRVKSVMHFAALSNVAESVQQATRYHEVNVGGTVALLGACEEAGVERLVFSSTASTYGQPSADQIPINETCPQAPINPYGLSKLKAEREITAFAAKKKKEGKRFSSAILRYFNVAGCDLDGLLGEDHRPESHLIPVVLEAMRRGQTTFTINGGDYPTSDGSCVRDYIHVDDLASAHLAVLESIGPGEEHAYNLGIGKGVTVREVIAAASRVTGVRMQVEAGPRRPGDPGELYADPSLIRARIGWTAVVKDIDAIVASAWRWMQANPQGYATAPAVAKAA